jgi:hypothetical protein
VFFIEFLSFSFCDALFGYWENGKVMKKKEEGKVKKE